MSRRPMKVPVDNINRSASTQARVSLDESVLAEYTTAWREKAEFPPVVVFQESSVSDVYWLGDGFHRVEAARIAGVGMVSADIRKGGQREALLFAAGANSAHGLRRTQADKRRCVELLLADSEWVKWSNVRIAKACAVSEQLVRDMRDDIETKAKLTSINRSEPPPTPPAKALPPAIEQKRADIEARGGEPKVYTTKHGTSSVMDVSRIGGRVSGPQCYADPIYAKPGTGIAYQVEAGPRNAYWIVVKRSLDQTGWDGDAYVGDLRKSKRLGGYEAIPAQKTQKEAIVALQALADTIGAVRLPDTIHAGLRYPAFKHNPWLEVWWGRIPGHVIYGQFKVRFEREDLALLPPLVTALTDAVTLFAKAAGFAVVWSDIMAGAEDDDAEAS